jgi:hypothetical protein
VPQCAGDPDGPFQCSASSVKELVAPNIHSSDGDDDRIKVATKPRTGIGRSRHDLPFQRIM